MFHVAMWFQKASEAELQVLENRLAQAERAKDLAQLEGTVAMVGCFFFSLFLSVSLISVVYICAAPQRHVMSFGLVFFVSFALFFFCYVMLSFNLYLPFFFVVYLIVYGGTESECHRQWTFLECGYLK